MKARYTEGDAGRSFTVPVEAPSPLFDGKNKAVVEVVERASGAVLIKVRPHYSARVYVLPLSDAAACVISRVVKANLAAEGRPVPEARKR